MANNKRAAHGSGTIRKKTVTRNGQDYTYWEARITTGYDAGTGRQKQRSVTGKTQKRCGKSCKRWPWRSTAVHIRSRAG